MKRILMPALCSQIKKQDTPPPPFKNQAIQTLKKFSKSILSKTFVHLYKITKNSNRKTTLQPYLIVFDVVTMQIVLLDPN